LKLTYIYIIIINISLNDARIRTETLILVVLTEPNISILSLNRKDTMYLLEAKARCADSVQNPEGTLEAGLSYTN
jgi:hypothetical protein